MTGQSSERVVTRWLQKSGFILVFKPAVVREGNGREIVKGNVDAEMVLHAAAIEYPGVSNM
jgi:uncharacterized LabA/DUF88 family protein